MCAAQLRVIIDPPASGAWNMAVDEALLLSSDPRITLRFYQWGEPTLSLGYFQAFADRQQHSSSLHCAVVRRASGGGAILHDQELTYSLISPVSHRFGASATELYDVAHASLLETLAQWGIQATLHPATEPRPSRDEGPFLCFQRRSPGDVLLAGHKICGSAQRRHLQRVLQHGSLLFSCSTVAPELPGLKELATAGSPEMSDFRTAWQAVLARRLQTRPTETRLTSEEHAVARGIQEGKFGNPNWTAKR